MGGSSVVVLALVVVAAVVVAVAAEGQKASGPCGKCLQGCGQTMATCASKCADKPECYEDCAITNAKCIGSCLGYKKKTNPIIPPNP